MNETDIVTDNLTDNVVDSSTNDYSESINEINETLKSINDNLKFLRDYFEITEEEQKIINEQDKKNNENLTKQRIQEQEDLVNLLSETSLNDIHNQLVLLNEKSFENNTISYDSKEFLSFGFILLLGLLVSFYVIKFIKSIFDSFYNF